MAKKFKDINEYINSFPDDVQIILQKLRKIIKEQAPNAEEAISYDIPTFKINGKYFIYFAGWKNHISFYPVPKGSPSFNKKIAPYIKGKGTVQFPLNEEMPYDLIREIVKIKLEQI